MAKFCKYCGTRLEEGHLCTCPQAQAEAASQQQAPQTAAAPPQPPQAPPQAQPQARPYPPQPQAQQPYQPQQPQPQMQQPYQQPAYTPPAAPAAPSPVGVAFKNLLPFLKAYFRSPVEAARTAVKQNDLILSIILLAIQAIAAGLMMFSMVHSTVSYMSASFFLCLIYGILAAVIDIMIFISLVFVVAKIVKSTCTYKNVFIACGAHSLLVTMLLLLAFLLFFASIVVGYVIFVLAMLVWIIMGVSTAQSMVPNSEKGGFWFSLIAAVLVTILVGGFFTSLLTTASMKTLHYNGGGYSYSYRFGGLEDFFDAFF